MKSTVTDITFKHNGCVYVASLEEGRWVWLFVVLPYHPRRGIKIPVPLAVSNKFKRMMPGVEIFNDSANG
jgi:hypothetical protein